MHKRYAAVCATLLLLATPGCEGTDKTGQGAVLGGLAGGALGNVVGRRWGGDGRVASTLVFGAGGALIGASIGQILDERDRARAEAATQAALRRPLPPTYYQPVYTPNTAPPAPTSTRPTVSPPRQASRPATRPQPPAAAETRSPPVTPSPSPTSSSARLPNLPIPEERWVSDHSGATGSVTVVSATAATGERGECRTLQQVAMKADQQRSETTTFCQKAPNTDDWVSI